MRSYESYDRLTAELIRENRQLHSKISAIGGEMILSEDRLPGCPGIYLVASRQNRYGFAEYVQTAKGKMAWLHPRMTIHAWYPLPIIPGKDCEQMASTAETIQADQRSLSENGKEGNDDRQKNGREDSRYRDSQRYYGSIFCPGDETR